MNQRDTNPTSLKITAISPDDAAKVLSSAYGRRVTVEQVREVVEAGQLARADGTFSLVEYVAYLAEEVTGG
jgi:hypothetical protein